MTISLGAYDSNALIGVVKTLPATNNFWRNLAFPRTMTFDTAAISFDLVAKGRRMAPFVAPNVAGKPMQSEGFTTKQFTPAYIKPKAVLDPERLIKRSAGEMFGGSLSPAQRRNAIVADILAEQKAMIEKRWEWMACEAIVKGTVLVSGESYPSVTVDFGRAAGQTITLAGATLWSAAGTSFPLKNLQTWYTATAKASATQVRDLVFGVDAWEAFAGHATVVAALDTRRGSDLKLETTVGLGLDDNFTFKGQLPNGPRMWVYSDVYEDESATDQQMLDPTYVIGIGGVEGVQAFGAILDARAGYQATALFPKMWLNEDPAVEYIMSQSAPLMIPRRPNASFRMQVLA
jgi:hypothetical protein